MELEGLSGDLKADQASGKVTWYRDTETIDLDFSKLELKQIFSAEKSLSSNFAGNDISRPITLNFKVDEFTNKFGTLGNVKLSVRSEPELKHGLLGTFLYFQTTSSFLLVVFGKQWETQKAIHCYIVKELS